MHTLKKSSAGDEALVVRCLLVSSVIEACQVADPSAKYFQEQVHPKLRELIPHKGFAMGMVRSDSLTPEEWVNFSVPRHYASSYVCPAGGKVFPVVDAWFCSGKPDLIDGLDHRRAMEVAWFAKMRNEGVSNMAVYGIKRDAPAHGLYIALTDLLHWGAWEQLLMQALTPHLRQVVKCQPREVSMGSRNLTSREQEVLKWVCLGKSNHEIAAILSISVWTVKIHVGKLLSKLNASTRGHAIAKAVAGNLVSFNEVASPAVPSSAFAYPIAQHERAISHATYAIK